MRGDVNLSCLFLCSDGFSLGICYWLQLEIIQDQGQKVKGLEYTLTERFLYSLLLTSLLLFSYIFYLLLPSPWQYH